MEFRGPGGQGLEFGSGGGRSGAHLYGRGNPAFVWQNDGRDRPGLSSGSGAKAAAGDHGLLHGLGRAGDAGGSLRYFLPRGAAGSGGFGPAPSPVYCQQLSEGIYRAPSGKRKFGNLDSGPCLLRRNRPVQRGDHSPFDEAQ